MIVDQREQQVLERRVLVMALVGERQSPVERLFKDFEKVATYNRLSNFTPVRTLPRNPHFFSMMHCNGC